MDALPEEQIRNEINEITTIPVLQRTEGQLQLLLAYNAELLRRHPERNTAPPASKNIPNKFLFSDRIISVLFLSLCISYWSYLIHSFSAYISPTR